VHVSSQSLLVLQHAPVGPPPLLFPENPDVQVVVGLALVVLVVLVLVGFIVVDCVALAMVVVCVVRDATRNLSAQR
jgi:hypothetical protein